MDQISQSSLKLPGFGEAAPGERQPTSVCRPGQVALLLLAGLCATALYLGVTFAAHRLLGSGRWADIGSVALGILFGCGGVLLAERGIAFYRAAHQHEYESLLPAADRVLDEGAPRLGERVKADLLVSNNVAETFQWKLEMVRRAEQSIDWSFNFAGGPEFQQTLDAIEQRMGEKPELRVHLLMSEDLLRSEDRNRLKELKQTYGDRFNYLITDRKSVMSCGPWRTEENHVKLLVVDGHTFALGGTGVCPQMTHEVQKTDWKAANAAERTMDPGFRDTDVIGRGCDGGNIAATMRCQFFNLYRKWQHRMGDPAPLAVFHPVNPNFAVPWERFDREAVKGAQVRFAVSGAEHGGYNPIDVAIVETLTQTEGPVLIGNCSNHPSPAIAAALAEKRKAGKGVVGIFNGTNDWFGAGSTGRKMWAIQSRQQYRSDWFSEVHEYDNSKPEAARQLYHKKVGVVGEIGERKAWVGSQNWSVKGHFYDDETALFIENDAVAGQVAAGLKVDKGRSTAVPLNPSSFSPVSWFQQFMMSLLGSMVF